MLVTTDYLSMSQHSSAVIMTLGQSDVETWRRSRGDKLAMEDWRDGLVHALSAATWQDPRQTYAYPWTGEGTAIWRPVDDSIQRNSVQSLLESAPTNVAAYLRPFSVLADIVESTRLHRLEEMYSFRDATAVRRFLQMHPHVVRVLLDAYPYLLKHFGPDPQVVLEVISDREAESWDQLFAYVCTPLPVNEALARLDKLDQEWFLDQLDRVEDLFNFNLEIV
jgi:hypothetical protein